MYRLLAGLFCLLALTGWGVHASSIVPEQSAEAWLAAMVRAGHERTYAGRSVYLSGDQIVSLEIRHALIEGESWERIIHLSDDRGEILRRGQQISCLHPENQTDLTLLDLSQSLKQPFQARNFQLPEHYRLVKGGKGRVAGRDAWQLDILPIDGLRYGYRLWLDGATAVMLKFVTLSQQGDALESFEFIQVEFDQPMGHEAFEPGEGLVWSKREPASAQSGTAPAEAPWQPLWLPKGFQRTAALNAAGDQLVSSRAYSDGLAALTVFAEPLALAGALEGSRRRGATLAVSRQLEHGNQLYLVTVVGEIPMETALQVAASVKFGIDQSGGQHD